MILIGGCSILDYGRTRGDNWYRLFSKSCGAYSSPSRGISRRPNPGGTETVGPQQRPCLRLPMRNGRQRKQPRPGVWDAGAMAAAVTAYPPAEKTRHCNNGNSIIISPGGTRRKRNLEQILRERKNDKRKKVDAPYVDARKRPNTEKIIYACYFSSLCLCLVEFSCVQVS